MNIMRSMIARVAPHFETLSSISHDLSLDSLAGLTTRLGGADLEDDQMTDEKLSAKLLLLFGILGQIIVFCLGKGGRCVLYLKDGK